MFPRYVGIKYLMISPLKFSTLTGSYLFNSDVSKPSQRHIDLLLVVFCLPNLYVQSLVL